MNFQKELGTTRPDAGLLWAVLVPPPSLRSLGSTSNLAYCNMEHWDLILNKNKNKNKQTNNNKGTILGHWDTTVSSPLEANSSTLATVSRGFQSHRRKTEKMQGPGLSPGRGQRETAQSLEVGEGSCYHTPHGPQGHGAGPAEGKKGCSQNTDSGVQ